MNLLPRESSKRTSKIANGTAQNVSIIKMSSVVINHHNHCRTRHCGGPKNNP